MAIHTELPIYKVTYQLLELVAKLAKNMPRDYKQSLGGKLRDECLEMSVLVFRANVAEQKSQHLLKLIEHQQVAELLLRLVCDLRLISHEQWAKAVELTTSIGKQANGWRRKAANRPAS
ncbi:four helix bundle protein [Methylobacillus pratensis]